MEDGNGQALPEIPADIADDEAIDLKDPASLVKAMAKFERSTRLARAYTGARQLVKAFKAADERSKNEDGSNVDGFEGDPGVPAAIAVSNVTLGNVERLERRVEELAGAIADLLELVQRVNPAIFGGAAGDTTAPTP